VLKKYGSKVRNANGPNFCYHKLSGVFKGLTCHSSLGAKKIWTLLLTETYQFTKKSASGGLMCQTLYMAEWCTGALKMLDMKLQDMKMYKTCTAEIANLNHPICICIRSDFLLLIGFNSVNQS